jgi:hypothetical protein
MVLRGCALNLKRMEETIIAVDAGVNGAIVVCEGRQVTVHRMPTKQKKNARGKKMSYTDVDKVYHILGKHRGATMVIEHVQMLPTDMQNIGKAMQMQRMTDNYTQIKTLALAWQMKVQTVMAKQWQDYLGFARKGRSKEQRKRDYRDAAQHWFKDHKVTLWNGDALCILMYYLRKQNEKL